MKKLICTVATVFLVIALSEQCEAIEFFKSIESAQKSVKEPQPMIISFGAAWCGWCRRMEADTFGHESVAAIEKDYLWVKLDIDNEPILSARYQVRGVPHTVVVNEKNRVIGMQSGYMNPEVFLKFVQDSFDNPLPLDLADGLLEQLANAEGEDYDTTIKKLVELISGPERTHRKRIVEVLASEGDAVYPLLLSMMEDDRLAVRAAAAYTLSFLTQTDLPFQPFDTAERRTEQVALWREKLSAS
ncbi:MAG: thioredoxin-related protein [Pirellulaceae bacterium]|jgi:thioredoxin-related protein